MYMNHFEKDNNRQIQSAGEEKGEWRMSGCSQIPTRVLKKQVPQKKGQLSSSSQRRGKRAADIAQTKTWMRPSGPCLKNEKISVSPLWLEHRIGVGGGADMRVINPICLPSRNWPTSNPNITVPSYQGKWPNTQYTGNPEGETGLL